jgi:lipopolysaccharide export system permease protein
MRILDRERYRAYFKSYIICFTALVGLYIVIDAFSNFDEFSKRADGVVEMFSVMGRFYLVHMSQFYDRLCGVIGMMAAIFTVTWMQKNNELLAMLAAGVSTQRVIRPVWISALLVSGMAVINQEFIMPPLGEELQKSQDDDGTRKVLVYGRYDAQGILIHGREADRKTKTVLSFNATLPVSVFGALRELEAKQARYIPETDISSPLRGGWLLRGAVLNPPVDDAVLKESQVLTRLENARGFPLAVGDRTEFGHDTYFLHSDLMFESVTRNRQWYQYAPTWELIRGLNDPVNEPEKQEIAVFLHGRILRPLVTLNLLLLSLPLVLGGYGRNMFVNLGLSLGTSGLFYGFNFMCQYLGNNDVTLFGVHATPELAAWAPLIVFGSIAVGRWSNIRT